MNIVSKLKFKFKSIGCQGGVLQKDRACDPDHSCHHLFGSKKVWIYTKNVSEDRPDRWLCAHQRSVPIKTPTFTKRSPGSTTSRVGVVCCGSGLLWPFLPTPDIWEGSKAWEMLFLLGEYLHWHSYEEKECWPGKTLLMEMGNFYLQNIKSLVGSFSC